MADTVNLIVEDASDILISDLTDPNNLRQFKSFIGKGLGYFSHPYSNDPFVNVAMATIRTYLLYKNGLWLISPLLMTHPVADSKGYADWLGMDFAIVDRCDYMILAPEWNKSGGCVAEAKRAQGNGQPLYFYGQVASYFQSLTVRSMT